MRTKISAKRIGNDHRPIAKLLDQLIAESEGGFESYRLFIHIKDSGNQTVFRLQKSAKKMMVGVWSCHIVRFLFKFQVSDFKWISLSMHPCKTNT